MVMVMVMATSAANHCRYCGAAHGAILRIYEKKPLVAGQVTVNYRKADITARQRASAPCWTLQSRYVRRPARRKTPTSMPCRFTVLTTKTRGTSPLSPHFFGLNNRMASFSGMQPKPEFYALGGIAEAPKPGQSH